jgi:CBS-domain-containing membrane protein
MTGEKQSLKPAPDGTRRLRRRLDLRQELLLAALPTATVLVVFGFVEALTQQQLLFASLASSAFLIYLDPQHGTNSVRTLGLVQILAATLGLLTYVLIGPGYLSGAIAMAALILGMILLDAVHPPATSTALSFAFRAGPASDFVIFGLAVGVTALLILLERVMLWLIVRHPRRSGMSGADESEDR